MSNEISTYLRVEPFTPIHIGCGDIGISELDYIIENGSLYSFDFASWCNSLSQKERESVNSLFTVQ